MRQSSREILATSADGSRTLTIGLAKIDPDQDTEASLTAGAQGTVTDYEALEQFGLIGSTAVASSGEQSVRLAVIDHGYRFLLQGEAPVLAEADAEFRTIIDSFRPLTGRENHWHQSYPCITFRRREARPRFTCQQRETADAGRTSSGSSSVTTPSGEPRTGDWVKVIR